MKDLSTRESGADVLTIRIGRHVNDYNFREIFGGIPTNPVIKQGIYMYFYILNNLYDFLK